MTSRVLVVGTNGESMLDVRAALEVRGLAVLTAGDGPSALASLESQRPDVILLEVDDAGDDRHGGPRSHPRQPAARPASRSS